MVIAKFIPYRGQHCETTTVGSLLKHIGLDYSEAMLFGIGEGLGFIVWKMKSMDFPFIGGRIKTDLLTTNICRNLDLDLEVKETSSSKKAWENVKQELAKGRVVGLKLDCYHLDYFTKKIHFAGHYASIYGYDEEVAYLNDTYQQGMLVESSLSKLELARNEKGPMSSKNLSFTISQNKKCPEFGSILRKAIFRNATDFLNPPIRNFGYKGMKKVGLEIRDWFQSSKDIQNDFRTAAIMMEKAGTGGSLFRNLYRDFLLESGEVLQSQAIKRAGRQYGQIAISWRRISDLFLEVAETGNEKIVDKAAALFLEVSLQEQVVMQDLYDILRLGKEK